MHGGTKLRMPFDAIRRRVADYVLGRIDGQGHEDPFHPDGPIQLASKMYLQLEDELREAGMPLPPVIQAIQQHMAEDHSKGNFGVIKDFTKPPYRDRWLALREAFVNGVLLNYTVGRQEWGVFSTDVDIALCSEVFGVIIHMYNSRIRVPGEMPPRDAGAWRACKHLLSQEGPHARRAGGPRQGRKLDARAATALANGLWRRALPKQGGDGELQEVREKELASIPHWHIVLHGGHYYGAPAGLSSSQVAHPWEGVPEHRRRPAAQLWLGAAVAPRRACYVDANAPPPAKFVDGAAAAAAGGAVPAPEAAARAAAARAAAASAPAASASASASAPAPAPAPARAARAASLGQRAKGADGRRAQGADQSHKGQAVWRAQGAAAPAAAQRRAAGCVLGGAEPEAGLGVPRA